MTKLYSGDLPVVAYRPQEATVSWNGRDDRGELVATGVYFFFISVDENEYSGKFTSIKE
jgi:hypothetical protein